MLKALMIGPGAAHHLDEAIRIFIDQIRIVGNLAPALFDRSQIFDAIVLDRLEQTFEPLASGRMIGRRVVQDRNEVAQGPGNRRSQGAR